MLSIRRSKIPRYLRSSAFYRNMSVGDGEFTVPEKCFKGDASIQSEFDFFNLLDVIQYWGLDSPPFELVSYVLDTDLDKMRDSNPNTWFKFKAMHFFENLVELQKSPRDKRIECAIQKRMPMLLIKELAYMGHKLPDDSFIPLLTHNYVQLAGDGNLQELQNLLSSNDCPFDAKASAAAALNGHLPILQLLNDKNAPWDSTVPTAAARGGHLECLKYLHENGCPWSEDAFSTAGINFHFDCMIYCEKAHPIPRNEEWLCIIKGLMLYRYVLGYLFPALPQRYWMYAFCLRVPWAAPGAMASD